MNSDLPSPTISRSRFLLLAVLVQGGVLLVAIGGGSAWGLFPLRMLRWESRDCLLGLLAVIPMLAVYRYSPGLQKLAQESLGGSLRQCRAFDLVVLAALAGVGEEWLFRGVLYEGLVPVNPWLALITANAAFGLLHALSWNYFFTAMAIGLGMHWLAGLSEPRNLLAPMIAHGVYDLVAFFLLRRETPPAVDAQ